MKEKIRIILKVIGGFLWIIGGGLLVSSIFIGIPVLILVLMGMITVGLIIEYIPQIIIVIIVFILLTYGFTKKVHNPYV